MKNWSNIFTEGTTFFLVILWVYAAIEKLLDFYGFEIQISRQALWPILQKGLVYLLPPTELGVAILLIFKKTHRLGLFVSGGLLFIFTVYIILALAHFFKRVPCACGGILTRMGWSTHLLFNLLCLALTIVSIIIIQKKGDFVTEIN